MRRSSHKRSLVASSGVEAPAEVEEAATRIRILLTTATRRTRMTRIRTTPPMTPTTQGALAGHVLVPEVDEACTARDHALQRTHTRRQLVRA